MKIENHVTWNALGQVTINGHQMDMAEWILSVEARLESLGVPLSSVKLEKTFK